MTELDVTIQLDPTSIQILTIEPEVGSVPVKIDGVVLYQRLIPEGAKVLINGKTCMTIDEHGRPVLDKP